MKPVATLAHSVDWFQMLTSCLPAQDTIPSLLATFHAAEGGSHILTPVLSRRYLPCLRDPTPFVIERPIFLHITLLWWGELIQRQCFMVYFKLLRRRIVSDSYSRSQVCDSARFQKVHQEESALELISTFTSKLKVLGIRETQWCKADLKQFSLSRIAACIVPYILCRLSAFS
ncbi:hypothetical protein J6590_067809 [Homalodisca vitripennis]|nr:hypothetical protein J6590_067809 [Homalodisca vitripennis]